VVATCVFDDFKQALIGVHEALHTLSFELSSYLVEVDVEVLMALKLAPRRAQIF
jgi:hypothetical protein